MFELYVHQNRIFLMQFEVLKYDAKRKKIWYSALQ